MLHVIASIHACNNSDLQMKKGKRKKLYNNVCIDLLNVCQLIDRCSCHMTYSGGGFWVGKAKSGQRHPCVYSYHGNIWVIYIRTFKLPFNIREVILTIDPSIDHLLCNHAITKRNEGKL